MISRRLYTLIFLLTAVLFFSCSADAKEKIVWPYICFKPVYVCDGDKLIGGSGYHILNLVWKKLPQFEHEVMQMPIKRILESAKSGEKQLFYGLFKTPDREKYLEYSVPCRIATPTYLVVRKSDYSAFGGGQEVSLKDVLENKDINFLYLKSFSFGEGIDEVLEGYKDNDNIITEYDTSDLIGKSLKLLIAKRVDAMLSVDGTLYDAREMGVVDDISYVSLAGQDKYGVGYITAPKNDWGKDLIDQINQILQDSVSEESFFEFFTPLVDDTMLPELRKKYKELILSPSNNEPEKLKN